MGKGSYIVVTGGKGNGKLCLIDTALNRQHGVVKLSVSHCKIFIYLLQKCFVIYRLNLDLQMCHY